MCNRAPKTETGPRAWLNVGSSTNWVSGAQVFGKFAVVVRFHDFHWSVNAWRLAGRGFGSWHAPRLCRCCRSPSYAKDCNEIGSVCVICSSNERAWFRLRCRTPSEADRARLLWSRFQSVVDRSAAPAAASRSLPAARRKSCCRQVDLPGAAQSTDGRRAPQNQSRVEAAYRQSLTHDHTGAQKTDS